MQACQKANMVILFIVVLVTVPLLRGQEMPPPDQPAAATVWEGVATKAASEMVRAGTLRLGNGLALVNLFEEDFARKVRDLSPEAKCRQAVLVLGEENYAGVKSLCLVGVAAADPELRRLAIRTLGSVLYDQSAVEVIKPFVLSDDVWLQLEAVRSLTCLGQEGARNLARFMALSKTLPQPQTRILVRTLFYSKDPQAAEIALRLSDDAEPPLQSQILRLLEHEQVYPKYLERVFLSNRYLITDLPPGSEEATNPLSHGGILEGLMMIGIASNPRWFKDNEAIRKKLRTYAAYERSDVWIKAISALEELGGELPFIKSLLGPKTSDRKSRFLKMVIDRNEGKP